MSGRGRGRGRGKMSFSVEALGFGRGETLPTPQQQPPQLFPPLDLKPLPLQSSNECEYLLALKQEFRTNMKESPYYIKPLEKRKDIERYSDKYQNSTNSVQFEPDWTRLPKELQFMRKRKAKMKSNHTPKLPKGAEILKKLEELEKKSGDDDDEDKEEEKGKDKEEDDEDVEQEEEVYEEEELEEETDYNLVYFDNGEQYGADDEEENLDDGPIY